MLAVKDQFDAFLAKFEKKYAYGGVYYVERLAIFAANLARAAERQARPVAKFPSGILGFWLRKLLSFLSEKLS